MGYSQEDSSGMAQKNITGVAVGYRRGGPVKKMCVAAKNLIGAYAGVAE